MIDRLTQTVCSDMERSGGGARRLDQLPQGNLSLAVMREVDGNKARASRQLGITRTQLYVRLRKYGLAAC